MTQVTEPFPIFYDDDGTPLENGMIYVGEANQDPRTNPVTVYTDEARTVPIAQPIRTLDGRPAYQGAPTNLYISEAAYSIAVQNRFGSPIVSADDVQSDFVTYIALAASGGSGLVGFIQSGTGAVARTVQAKLRDVISIKDFGAVGDGVADDTDAFEAALLEANATNGVLVGDGRTYRITRRINVNRTGKASLRIDLRGSTILLDDAEIWFGRSGNGNPSEFLSTTLTADVAKGGKLLPMGSITGLAVGDLIQIESPAYSCATTATCHSYIVETISGGNVYIRGTFVADITAQQVIDSGVSGPIVIKAYKLDDGLVIENGFIEHTDPLGLRVGINITQQRAPIIRNLHCDGQTRIQVQIIYGTDDLNENCTFRRYGYCDPIEPDTVNPSAPDGLPFGYGLAHARNYRSTVRGCSGALGWHAFDAARGQMYIDYIDCSGFRDAYTFATHESSWFVNYINCTAIGRMGFLLARSAHPRMVNCGGGIDGSTTTNFIGLARSSNTVTIEGGNFKATTAGHLNTSADSNPKPGIVSVGDLFPWTISGATFTGAAPITFGTPLGRTYIENSSFLEGAAFGEVIGAIRDLDRLTFDGAHASFAIVVSGGSTRVRNVKSLTAASGSSTALVAVVGVPTLLEVFDSATASEYIVRMLEGTSVVKINSITNSKGPRIVLGSSNVTVANIINTYRTQPELTVGGAVVTQGVNNVTLAA